jgi:1-acyl-sn-glycerol-3-phosphate acyltransferase
MLWAAGAKVTVHGAEKLVEGEPHIFVANHLSWFDIPSLAGYLPRYKFVAKAELFKIPIFGPAIRAVGMIPIERENRKAAFDSYKVAAEKIQHGNSVVVYPEGTRGTSYPIRPFKKGPFVLAIAAGVPIVPVLLHGTLEVFGKGAKSVRPGRIDIHLLEPVPTAGLNYDDREKLANDVRDRMVAALEREYGIKSPPAQKSRA